MTRIGIFGGAFDPPHLGHLALGAAARDQLDLDLVYWIPAGSSPHKHLAVESPPPAARLALVQAAIAGAQRFQAFDCELARPGVSYSVETIREVGTRHPGADLFLILGADAYALAPAWREAGEVAALAAFAVGPRPGAALAALPGFRLVPLDLPPREISSTLLRARLRGCRDVSAFAPPPVIALVEAEAWYLPPAGEGMRRHLANVEAAAAGLAERWDLPGAALRLAARYHDSYRLAPGDELVRILESRGELVRAQERAAPVLLHGRAAAARLEATASARSALDPVRVQVHAAVRFHTTGRAGMSPIEETLFVADRMGKDWHDLAEIPPERGAAVAAVLARKLAKLAALGRPPHRRMLEAAAAYGVT